MTTLTIAQLRAATGANTANATRFLAHIEAAIRAWRIEAVPEFLAQIGVESAHLARTCENLNYTTPERIMEVWPRRFPTRASALPYVRHPKLLANFVYANRNGNGTIESGDGWRYRGRGLKQLTGAHNYAAYEAATGHSVLVDPDMLAAPDLAADSAGWFWQSNRCDDLAHDVRALTRRVNGGFNGLDERRRLTAAAHVAFASRMRTT